MFRVYNPSSPYEKTVFALHINSSACIYAILSFNKAEIDFFLKFYLLNKSMLQYLQLYT